MHEAEILAAIAEALEADWLEAKAAIELVRADIAGEGIDDDAGDVGIGKHMRKAMRIISSP